MLLSLTGNSSENSFSHRNMTKKLGYTYIHGIHEQDRDRFQAVRKE